MVCVAVTILEAWSTASTAPACWLLTSLGSCDTSLGLAHHLSPPALMGRVEITFRELAVQERSPKEIYRAHLDAKQEQHFSTDAMHRV